MVPGHETVCRRWFITVNGRECLSPVPIVADRSATLGGFCSHITRGHVTVGLSIRGCSISNTSSNAFSCFDSVCRFIIEEVPSLPLGI